MRVMRSAESEAPFECYLFSLVPPHSRSLLDPANVHPFLFPPVKEAHYPGLLVRGHVPNSNVITRRPVGDRHRHGEGLNGIAAVFIPGDWRPVAGPDYVSEIGEKAVWPGHGGTPTVLICPMRHQGVGRGSFEHVPGP